MLCVLSVSHIVQAAFRYLGQPQGDVEFTIGEQPGI